MSGSEEKIPIVLLDLYSDKERNKKRTLNPDSSRTKLSNQIPELHQKLSNQIALSCRIIESMFPNDNRESNTTRTSLQGNSLRRRAKEATQSSESQNPKLRREKLI